MTSYPPKNSNDREGAFVLTRVLTRSAVAIALLSLGILNGARGERVLLVLGAVSGILSFVYPYLPKGKIRLLYLSLSGVLGAAFLDILYPAPARAQFFKNAQTFFESSFPSAATGIPIVFNTLRGLYILYLAIAFIGVFNSARQDDDWMTAARTPILVVIVVTLADIMTNVIIGGN